MWASLSEGIEITIVQCWVSIVKNMYRLLKQLYALRKNLVGLLQNLVLLGLDQQFSLGILLGPGSYSPRESGTSNR